MHQRRQTALENKETRQNNRLREERRLQHSLLVSIKSTAALYFYNHDPDPVNHDLDVVGDDDNENDDNDDKDDYNDRGNID